MNLATTYTRAPLSMHAPLVRVEVHLASGLPAMTLVGLPEKAVKESKDRVRAAILNSGFEFPAKHITINLAPAELPKDGARYDLAIALGILAASGQIPPDATAAHEYHGELALSGQLRPVSGILHRKTTPKPRWSPRTTPTARAASPKSPPSCTASATGPRRPPPPCAHHANTPTTPTSSASTRQNAPCSSPPPVAITC